MGKTLNGRECNRKTSELTVQVFTFLIRNGKTILRDIVMNVDQLTLFKIKNSVLIIHCLYMYKN